MLHLVGGGRRRGDFEEHLEFSSVLDSLVVAVLAIDAAVNEELGDLSKVAVLDYWWGEVKRILARGTLTSPPCETCSFAMWNDDGGPPPAIAPPRGSPGLGCFWPLNLILIPAKSDLAWLLGLGWLLAWATSGLHILEAQSRPSQTCASLPAKPCQLLEARSPF